MLKIFIIFIFFIFSGSHFLYPQNIDSSLFRKNGFSKIIFRVIPFSMEGFNKNGKKENLWISRDCGKDTIFGVSEGYYFYKHDKLVFSFYYTSSTKENFVISIYKDFPRHKSIEFVYQDNVIDYIDFIRGEWCEKRIEYRNGKIEKILYYNDKKAEIPTKEIIYDSNGNVKQIYRYKLVFQITSDFGEGWYFQILNGWSSYYDEDGRLLKKGEI